MDPMKPEIEALARQLSIEGNRVIWPDPDELVRIIDCIRRIIFPEHDKPMSQLLESLRRRLTRQIALVCPDGGEKTCMAFLRKLPELRAVVQKDLQAAFDGDPAAKGTDEILLCYPGLFAVTVYRAAHELYLLDVPMIPRMMTEYAHGLTGIDIHPGAVIGAYFFIDHGTGVVIGETTRIGDHVKIYQGVTLGALSTRAGQGLRGVKRHPTVCDHVTIYAGASILGGDTVIGENSVLGSNVFITSSVAPGTRVSAESNSLQFHKK